MNKEQIMKLTNPNYCATIVRVKKTTPLEGCDNLVWINIFWYNIIAQKDIDLDGLHILFTAESQLHHDFLHHNNLYSSSDLNKDVRIKGYIGKNRRVRAIKLRGHSSNAMLMPLKSLIKMSSKASKLKEGDTFNEFEGYELCRKYELVKDLNIAKNKIKGQTKKYTRIDGKNFPEHFSTEQYLRNEHKLADDDEVIVTQKLHGTSVRLWNVEVKIKPTLLDRVLRRERTEYDYLAGSRRVIKDLKSNTKFQHYYETNPWQADIYNRALETVKSTIPKDVMYYAEIIGFNGPNSPIQKGYTYNLPDGQFAIYIYRITSINSDGRQFDWGWDAMREFAKVNDLLLVPEIDRMPKSKLIVDMLMNINYSEALTGNVDEMVSLPKGAVDEGVCIRREGLSPYVTKAKCSKFFEFETKLLDEGIEVAG